MKQGKQDYSKRDMIIGVVVLAGAAILAAIVIMPRMMNAATGGGSSAAPTRKATQIVTVQSGSGRGDEVSPDFTVPVGCPRLVLSYSGEKIDTSLNTAFVNFRVYDATGFPGDSAIGPAHLGESPEGSGQWSLKAGDTYSIEITSGNAEWQYQLQCR